MHVIAFLFLIFIVVTSIFAFPKRNQTVVKTVRQEVRFPTTTPGNVPTITQPLMTITLEPSETKVPSITPIQQNDSAKSVIYPNAIHIIETGNTISFQTTDDTDTVSNWYKNLIISFHMNTQTFIKTNTNGNILNKLVGVNGNEKQLRVEISKGSTMSVTSVIVTFNL
jgi:hypothetical protein